MTSVRHTILWIALTLAALAAITRPVHAQIRWRNGKSVPSNETRATALEVVTDPAKRNGARHIMIQLDHPLTGDLRARFRNAGVSLQNYLGDNAYFASIADRGPNHTALVGQLPQFDALPIDTSWKLHPVLDRGESPGWAIVPAPTSASVGDDPSKAEWFAGYILFHKDVSMAEAANVVTSHGAVIRRQLVSVNGMVIEMPMENAKALAGEDVVMYLEPALPQFQEVNDSNRAITEANVVQAAPYALDGSGVNVLVYDGGYARASHVDFQSRLSVRDTSGLSNHATHVSGTIGGAGVANPIYRGMAPGVTIQSYGFEQAGGLQPGFLYTDPGDLEADYSEAINVYGADISNNSIGTNTAPNGFPCEWTGNYGVTSAVIDSVVRGGLSGGVPFRVVWANGNERQTIRCGNTYQTTAPPACAKNHITVGALNSNDDSVAWFTSWGPADDGRLKPDISAPGCQAGGDGGVTSCSAAGDASYTTYCGTSMASPTVCGLSALLLQDFRIQFPGQPDFRNSTLKALLAHCAEDIEAIGPDYKTGYGSVRIQRTIDFLRTGAFTEETINQGESYARTVIVNSGDPELKATLAWDDPPGTPNVNPALVNDLDLRVVSPSGVRHFPWTLGGVANPATPAVRTQEDHINNIEQVLIENPEPGAWTVEVFGFNVPEGPQTFSLVGDGASNEGTSISFPNGLPATLAPNVATVVDVRVASNGESLVQGSPTFYYRYDGGVPFQSVPLTLASGDLYQATFPPPVCGDVPEYYFSAEGSTTGIVHQPADAPATWYTALTGETVQLLIDNGEYDQGWVASNTGISSGDWQRGRPVNAAGWAYDPVSDSDGSGRCYVTQNTTGDSDVDGGTVRLTSPQLDMSAGDAQIGYDYYLYLTDTTGADALVVEVNDNDGTGQWVEIARHDTSGGLSWRHHEIDQAALDAAGVVLTSTMRLRFSANDAMPDNVVEAGVDAIKIISFPCGVVTGGCCTPDGACTMRTSASCAAIAGTYQGDGVSCLSYPCPVPSGACCYTSGSCLVQSTNACEDGGGTYLGHNISCTPNPCPQPTGACCDLFGICSTRTASGCADIGGTYQGDGIFCIPHPCPAPRGACCDAEGSCGEEPEPDCLDNGGTYLGDGVPCTPNPCPQPLGACCQIDGTCIQESESGCGITGGDYIADGAECTPNPCDQPEDACCLPNGDCERFTLSACNAAGGVYQGFGVTCTPTPCVMQTGACCESTGACQNVADQAACDAIGGTFQGDGTDCGSSNCPPPGDVNCDGATDIADITAFAAVLVGVDTNACHVSAADLNADALVNGNDVQFLVDLLQ